MIYIIREEFLIFINTFFYQKNSKDIFMRKIKYNKKKKRSDKHEILLFLLLYLLLLQY